ncbi:MAG: hypothetical protein ABI672_15465 [Vicinamibacteria bacterium]
MWDEIRQFPENISAAAARAASLVPRLLVAFLSLLVGWLIARGLRTLTIRALRLARVNEAAERMGIDDYLLQGGVRSTTATLAADAVYWITILASLLIALSVLGIDTAGRLLDRLGVAVPNGIAVALFVVLGVVLGQFAGALAFSYLNNLGISSPRGISLIAQYAMTLFVISVGMEELSIGGQLLIFVFQAAFVALCLGFALAFGLGGREWAAKVLNSWWKV